MKWNDDWRGKIPHNVYERLCECRNRKGDIFIIAKAMSRENPERTKEECLDRTIEWITGSNNQVNLIPEPEEYSRMLDKL